DPGVASARGVPRETDVGVLPWPPRLCRAPGSVGHLPFVPGAQRMPRRAHGRTGWHLGWHERQATASDAEGCVAMRDVTDVTADGAAPPVPGWDPLSAGSGVDGTGSRPAAAPRGAAGGGGMNPFAELSPPYSTIVVDPPWHYDE